VANGVLQAAQDGLGFDYNGDGKGNGFNVPSLLGLELLPPYLHNGSAESLAAVVADVNHRMSGGQFGDVLADPADQALVVKFLQSIDLNAVPFVTLSIHHNGNQITIAFDSVAGARYALETRPTIDAPWTTLAPLIVGTGQSIGLSIQPGAASQFLRLVAAQ
jgi:hypothetical protein